MKSSKGPTQTADLPATRQLLLSAVAAAPEPLTLKTLGSISGLARKIPGSQVSAILAEDLQAGGLFEWGTSKKAALWNRDPKGAARQRILEIAAANMLGRAVLDRQAAGQAPEIKTTVVRTAREELQKEGLLREVPGAAGAKCLINVARPELYLEAQIARLLESFGKTRSSEQIRSLLLADSGVQATGAGVRDMAEKIFTAMNRIAFSPGATVTFYRLRQEPELAGISKEVFDRAALLLQDERKALLSVHDHAASLPAEERERFVTDGLGHFYVSIYAR